MALTRISLLTVVVFMVVVTITCVLSSDLISSQDALNRLGLTKYHITLNVSATGNCGNYFICMKYWNTAVRLNHTEALQRLNDADITVWSIGNCTDRNNKRCTSLEQIRMNTIIRLISLKENSECPMTVTGGTETGHGTFPYSHWNGYKIDIRRETCINHFIRTWYTYAGRRKDYARQHKDYLGNVYTEEGPHWDILYRH